MQSGPEYILSESGAVGEAGKLGHCFSAMVLERNEFLPGV